MRKGCLKGRVELKRSVFNPPEGRCRLFGVNDDVLIKKATIVMMTKGNEQMWVVVVGGVLRAGKGANVIKRLDCGSSRC